MERKILTKVSRISQMRIDRDTKETLDAFGTDYNTLVYYSEATGQEMKRVQILGVDTAPDKEVPEEVVTPAPVGNTIVNCFDKTHVQVLESAIKLNRPVLLVGHTGLGKTTLVQELANEAQKELVRISVHSGITADEIIGKWLAVNGSTVWQDGILTMAMRKGDWVVFDEINACPADVMFALHSLLDDARQITLLEKDGEIVKPADGFRFFATMNPPDDYAGTKEMNMAFLSRFNAVINITGFDAVTEANILVSKGIKLVDAQKLVGYAGKLRELKSQDKIMFYCGTRDIINAGLLIVGGLSMDDAIHFAIWNKMNEEDKEETKAITPNGGFMTQEQRKIKELENLKNVKEKENNVLNETLKKVDEIVKELKQSNEELKKQVASGAGGSNLSADTQKALKILKVLS